MKRIRSTIELMILLFAYIGACLAALFKRRRIPALEALILALGLCLAPSAKAQLYGTFPLLTTGTTNYLVAVSTNSYGTGSTNAISLTKYTQYALQVGWAYTAGTNGNNVVTLRFANSLDGVTYENVPAIIVTANNTNFVTNVVVNAVGYIKLKTIENTNNIGLTNFTVTIGLKPNRGVLF